MEETWVQSLGWEDPLEETWQPTPVFLPGESHGQRIPWGLPSMGSQTVGWGDKTKKLMGIRLLEIYRPLLGVYSETRSHWKVLSREMTWLNFKKAFNFIMEYSWFTVLCFRCIANWFKYILCIYIYISFKFFSHYSRALSRVPCAIQ